MKRRWSHNQKQSGHGCGSRCIYHATLTTNVSYFSSKIITYNYKHRSHTEVVSLCFFVKHMPANSCANVCYMFHLSSSHPHIIYFVHVQPHLNQKFFNWTTKHFVSVWLNTQNRIIALKFSYKTKLSVDQLFRPMTYEPFSITIYPRTNFSGFKKMS